MASTAFLDGMKYSDCNSFPLLGVKPILKWGSRSYQGPGTPNCSVQFSADNSIIGCIFFVAALAPKNSFTPWCSVNLPERDLIQTSLIISFCQSVKRLTL